MLSSGANVLSWDKMLLCGANVVMLSFGANVIIWCYHVMLSSRMITPSYFIFPENFTHSKGDRHLFCRLYWQSALYESASTLHNFVIGVVGRHNFANIFGV